MFFDCTFLDNSRKNTSDKSIPKPDPTTSNAEDVVPQSAIVIASQISVDSDNHYSWDGYVYEGLCEHGSFSGHGTITFPENAAVFTADFSDGTPKGVASLKLKNGDEFTLENINGYVMDGSGTYRWNDGTSLTALFVAGLPDDENAVLRFADGSRFEGVFQSGAIYKGTWYDADGNIISKGNAGKKTKYLCPSTNVEYVIDDLLTHISPEQFPRSVMPSFEIMTDEKGGFSTNLWDSLDHIAERAATLDTKAKREFVMRLMDLIIRISSGHSSDLLR